LAGAAPDGAPLAFHFGFDYAGSVIWYKPSFEIRHAARSPGLLLIRNMIQDALERKRHELDFTIGDEQFKDRFANAERVNLNVAIYHNRLLCAVAAIYRRVRRVIAAALRASDKRTWPRAPRAVEG
jgi:CelD/BcsL family acetyltransferase involved in cellulose biosynthesis